MQHATGSPPATRPPLTRRSRHKIVAGVAGGLGDHFHIEPNLVRLAFVVLTLAGGAGAVLYAAGWLFLPTDGGEDGADGSGDERSRNDLVQVLALGAVTLGVLLLAKSIGLGFGDALLWPIVLAAMGTALIVGRSGRPIDELIGELVRRERGVPKRDDTGDARHGVGPAGRGGRRAGLAGVGAFLATQGAFRAIGQGLLAVAVILGGLGLVFGPWLWRLWNALVEERSERIRSDERAEMAAHLHDSVLQTLALIQRRADDPRAVVGLARSQERELRAWLFGRAPVRRRPRSRRRARSGRRRRRATPGRPDRDRCASAGRARSTTACARSSPRAQEAIAQRGAPLRRAPSVAVYEEVEADQVTVFVRDRGRGFDPATVPTDRGGIAESITGRMQRHGGRAVIRSRPGSAAPRSSSRCTPGRPCDGYDAPRVFLVDDHHLFRSGVRAEFGDDAEVVGEASEVDAAIDMIGERAPDVVLVDVHMPDGGGEAVIRAVLAEHPTSASSRCRCRTHPRT